MSISISLPNCEYRAEGNAGVVISLIAEGEVLRLKKKNNASKAFEKSDKTFKELENQIQVAKYVLKPLLGNYFVHIPKISFLKAEEITLLNSKINKFRPAYRKDKSIAEEDTYVFVLPDFCTLPPNLKYVSTCGPVLSIEIKPKQGFVKDICLPTGQSLPYPLCRCCVMKTHKLTQGMISSLSSYCPIDLFSGCYTKMMHALKMLCTTPQNNFRIFKDQKLVFSEEKRNKLSSLLEDFFDFPGQFCYLDLLSDLIIKALTKPFPFEYSASSILPKKHYLQCCVNAHTICSESDPCHELPRFCVLERILSCQLLDDLNISEVYEMYCKIKDRNRFHDYIGCYSFSEIPPYIGNTNRHPNESEYEYASRKVWEFLIALTAKDCSVMLVMKRLSKGSYMTQMQNLISDMCGNLYIFSIAIADLDFKSPCKVEKVYSDWSFILNALSQK